MINCKNVYVVLYFSGFYVKKIVDFREGSLVTDKELRHLNRSELLQMLIAQGEENRKLKEQLDEANRKLNKRQLVMENAGSIAEASLRLNGVFEAAEQAARQYLESVKTNAVGNVDIQYEKQDSSCVTAETSHKVSPCVKTADMSSDEYWQQVKKRVQMILDTQN